MRRFLPWFLALIAAGCATAPQQQQPSQPQVTAPPSVHTRGAIIGMTAEDLVRRFGTPALQVREGNSLKLQFRSDQCVLDAYLYPTGNAPYRVTYVDTRTRSLNEADQAICVDSLQAP